MGHTDPITTDHLREQYIFVVTDHFSKWTEAFTLKMTDSETLARVLVDEVIYRYGMPSTLTVTKVQTSQAISLHHYARCWEFIKLEHQPTILKAMHKLSISIVP